jgi:hypothetical protein
MVNLDIDELVFHMHQMGSLGSPRTRNHRSVFNWIYNEKPINKDEDRFIYHKGDLVTLSKSVEGYNIITALMYSLMDRFKPLIVCSEALCIMLRLLI